MAAAALDVVVIGSCMIDLVTYVPSLPRPGETVHGTSFSQGFGGKGANQCVMAALLGARCAMVAKLGDDDFGRSTLKNFEENGINLDHVMSTGEASSGVASITVNDRGENAIVIVAGANALLTPKEVSAARDLVARAKVVVCQLEVEPETTLAAMKMARELGVITILNTAPALKGLGREFFENSDILCLNETEAEVLTGVSVSDLPSASAAVTSLQGSGTRCIVLTLGEKGLLYSVLVEKEWTETRHIQAKEVMEVNVVDTTGAGDAFVGALAHFLASSPSSPPGVSTWRDPTTLRNFLRMSAEIASASVMFKGTQTSFKRIDLQSLEV